MTRYLPARHYLWSGATAVVLSGACAGIAFDLKFTLAYLPAGLCALMAILFLLTASRPAVEIHESYLSIGKRIIPWMDIRRIDRTGWNAPLIVRITLFEIGRASRRERV